MKQASFIAAIAAAVAVSAGCTETGEVGASATDSAKIRASDEAADDDRDARLTAELEVKDRPPPEVVIDGDGVETTIYEVERTPTPELLPIAEVARLARDNEAVLCDVNVPEARAYFGVVPGALELSDPTYFSLDELPEDRDVPLIFYCSTPSCGASLQSGTRAILAGYKEVYALKGGIAAWLEAGGETVPMTRPAR